ncbi:unnamed protein product [Prunus brigantina]
MCHHHSNLHKVPHRNFVQTSHFHLPINREQYPSKRGSSLVEGPHLLLC